MRRVLFFIESLGQGGAEKILVDLCGHIDRSRFDVTLLVVSEGGAHWDAAARSGVRLRCLFTRAAAESAGLRGLWYRVRYHLLRRLPPRMAHLLFIRGRYDTEAAFAEGLATRLISRAGKRCRKLAWVHIDPIGDPHADFLFNSRVEQEEAYRRFDRVLCVSSGVRAAFENKFGPLPNLAVQYNPVDTESIRRRANESADPWNAAFSEVGGRLRMLCIARLVKAKGVDRLLRACARLRAEGHAFSLLILGEGPMRGELETIIEDGKLGDCVRLAGYLPNPYPALRGTDLYVCASYAEGFSTAATEALVLGKPICSTDCAGMREVLGDQPCGLLTENTEEGIYAGLRTLLSVPARVEELRAAALRRGKEFSLAARLDEIEQML